jgi:hypothetical protein
VSRQCGECTLCCKLLGIKELRKPQYEWCPHCDIGHGCTIYGDRPQSCRDYECMWLQTEVIPDECRPDRSHVVLTMLPDNEHIQVNVDPQRPEAHKTGLMGGVIGAISHQFDLFVIIGPEKRQLVTTKSPDEVRRMVKDLIVISESKSS